MTPRRAASRRARGCRASLVAVVALVASPRAPRWLVVGQRAAARRDVPSLSSVDAGFARDMSTHHTQAVMMAGYERHNTSNPALKLLANDIYDHADVPDRRDAGLARHVGALPLDTTPPMAWMAGHDHLSATG